MWLNIIDFSETNFKLFFFDNSTSPKHKMFGESKTMFLGAFFSEERYLGNLAKIDYKNSLNL